MCGIAGFVGAPGRAVDAVRGWGACLAHRGPDDLGLAEWRAGTLVTHRDPAAIAPDSEVVLWHRRLSILDLSPAGAQPMSTADGRWHLVLNGEIYDYLELREELEREGVRFRSRSDTEVLLEAFARRGPALLPRLTGMFAFAALDTVERRLYLARDAFGIKPLVWSRGPWGFAFASEPKALLALPEVSREVDPQRVYDYLRFGLTDHGDGTLLAAVRQLPAAHWMEVPLDGGEPSAPVRWWTPGAGAHTPGSFEQAATRVRECFLDSVRLHLRSDVPVGAALSGGIDSSAIVMAMRAVAPDLDLHTFSYVADDPRLSEERWVDLVGRACGAHVHRIVAGPDDLLADLDPLLAAQDEPFGSTSLYAQHRVFRAAREHGVTVMLDGQGADELLGGYTPFVAARLASLVRAGRLVEAVRFLQRASSGPARGALALWAGEFLVPPAMQAPLRALVGQELSPSWLDASWFRARGVRLAPAKYTHGDGAEVLRAQLVRATTWSSLPMLLRYEDRNSMAHSIESRVPFLTTRLADLLLSLPEEYLVDRDGTTKAVFRRAMRGLVPDAVLDRRDKIGFATPEAAWRRALRPRLEARFAAAAAEGVPVFRHEALARAFATAVERGDSRDFRPWRWFNLLEWAHRIGARFA